MVAKRQTSTPDKGIPIRALSRGIAVLQAVNRGGSLSMMAIARTSEVPYPTACRIVQTLVHEGLLEREPRRKLYRPTALVQTLAHGFQGHSRLVQVARPHMAELTDRVGWPITLSTHVGHSMIIRDSTHAQTALTFSEYFPGYASPILECAAGIIHLAFMPTEQRQVLLHSLKLMPNISAHMLDIVENSSLLDDVRHRGYASREYNQFTRNPGKTSSIAVPLHQGSEVVGAITLAFFSSAMKMNQAIEIFAPPLSETASAIGRELDQQDNEAL
jgi:IclR family mhp operon transcriptional activator